MLARVLKTQSGFVVEVPQEAVEKWQLVDGSAVQLTPFAPPLEKSEEVGERVIQYATIEEVLEAFESTLPDHEAAYRELAK